MAQLYQLYLDPANASVASSLYVEPCSSNLFVQWTIAHQLRTAAEQELAKTSASDTIVEEDVMREASNAFSALSDLLGTGEWFFGQNKPTVFDASVFAYTHLILDEGIQWQGNKLAELLEEHENLVKHNRRIREMYY
jgi:metaxin